MSAHCDLAATFMAVCMQCIFFFFPLLLPWLRFSVFSEIGRWQPKVRGQRAKLTPSIPLDSYKRALNSGQNNPWIMRDGLEGWRGREKVSVWLRLAWRTVTKLQSGICQHQMCMLVINCALWIRLKSCISSLLLSSFTLWSKTRVCSYL